MIGRIMEQYAILREGFRATGPGRLKLWDLKTGAVNRDLVGHADLTAVVFSADGRRLASAGNWLSVHEGGVGTQSGWGAKIWDPVSGELKRTITALDNGLLWSVAFAGLILGTVIGWPEESEKERVAEAGAEKWLGVAEEGKYGESWKEAAEYFRNAVKQEQWEQTMQAVRKPLGRLVSRKVKSTSYKTSLPGAPDGQYVVIECETSFENKKSAIETVTLMMDKDGNWRVSGHFIK